MLKLNDPALGDMDISELMRHYQEKGIKNLEGVELVSGPREEYLMFIILLGQNHTVNQAIKLAPKKVKEGKTQKPMRNIREFGTSLKDLINC
jgi:hypothetical protein